MLSFIFKSFSASKLGWIVLNALEKAKELETNVGTRFVQMRIDIVQYMQNSIFPPLPPPASSSSSIP